MRLLATADLHYNHPRSRPLADALIDQINAAGGDALLVIGDTAAFDGAALESCLSRFRFAGRKLFVSGNHELWTRLPDSLSIFKHQLPARIRALGWHWLQDEPVRFGDDAIVGSLGWYDYSFAAARLKIPERFYAAKISPGIAQHDPAFATLAAADVPPEAQDLSARWNDGRHVKLGMSDHDFLELLLEQLASQLDALADAKRVVAAIHQLPFAQLLPPPASAQWDFAKAYLGSRRIGQLLVQYPNVSHVLCGHSHYPIEATVEGIRAVNIGSGYRSKRFITLDLA